MKKFLKITICFILIVSFVICLNIIYYPIKLNINRGNINYAEIIYYGDGVEQIIEDKNDLDLLIQKLNELKFRRYKDMDHLAPRSGVLVINLYNANNTCIDSIQFYTWVYRGGEAYGEDRGDGMYLKVKNSEDIYVLCDELCGDPFDRLEHKKQYGW